MPRSARTALFLLAGAAAAIACAADLEGKPEEYTAAYNGPPGGGTGNVGTAGMGTAGMGTAGMGTAGMGTAGMASGGSSGSGGTVVPPDPDCVKTVLSKPAYGCTTLCHNSAKLGGLDLTGNELGKRLSTTPAVYQVTSGASDCDQGALLIQPDDPARSVLLRKVKNTQSCGDAMPIGSGLMGEDLACIENWVNSFGAGANRISLDEASGIGGNNP